MENIPKVLESGIVKFAGMDLNFFVLDNGQRIIDEESMLKFMDWLHNG